MNEERVMVPYFVHEGEMARMERIVKRLWILSGSLAVVIMFMWFFLVMKFY